MAMGISITDEGVQALKTLSSTLHQELENMRHAHENLKTTYESVADSVAHQEELYDILEDICAIQAKACVPVATLVQKTSSLADQLDQFIHKKLGGAGGN